MQGHNAVQHDPESFLAKWELAFTYHWKGQHAEAIAMFEPLWASSGHNWVALGLVPAYMRAGREDRARSLYASLVDRDAREYVPPFVLAVCAAAVGDREGYSLLRGGDRRARHAVRAFQPVVARLRACSS
jgi:Flp pilus assembly protein TadD